MHAKLLAATFTALAVVTLALPDIQARLHEMAAEPTPQSPGQFEGFLKTEVAKWTQLVRSTNLKVE